jgi:thiol-disulfide isomerase/thioredoxin
MNRVPNAAVGRAGAGSVRGMSMRARAVILAVIVLAVACGTSAGVDGAGQYTTLAGTAADLSALQGKPTVVNFFASWCTPCRLEMPDFEKVHTNFGDRVNFLGLNVEEDLKRAQSIVNDTKVTYAIGLDPKGKVFRQYKAVNMPSTVLLDAGGQLVELHQGAMTAADLTKLIQDKLGVT